MSVGFRLFLVSINILLEKILKVLINYHDCLAYCSISTYILERTLFETRLQTVKWSKYNTTS